MSGHVTSALNTAFQCCIVPQLVGCFVFFSPSHTASCMAAKQGGKRRSFESDNVGEKIYLAWQLARSDFYSEAWLIHLFSQSSNISRFQNQSTSIT